MCLLSLPHQGSRSQCWRDQDKAIKSAHDQARVLRALCGRCIARGRDGVPSGGSCWAALGLGLACTGCLADAVWAKDGTALPASHRCMRLHGVGVHPEGCCPWHSRSGPLCSACFLRPRLAFYTAHASIQTTRSSYTRSMSHARPSTYGWPHSGPPLIAELPACDAGTWVACPLLRVGVRQCGFPCLLRPCLAVAPVTT